MTLVDYIKQIGDAEAAKRWGVTERAAASWRRRERFPRPAQADLIVRTSPVTYAGIYGSEEECAKPAIKVDRRKSGGRRRTDKVKS